MKKKNVIGLIRSHIDGNEQDFRLEAADLAKELKQAGYDDLAGYILALISDEKMPITTPDVNHSRLIEPMKAEECMLLLPDSILHELVDLVNDIRNGRGSNRFLFIGDEGTGKTEAVKQMACILGRTIYRIDCDNLMERDKKQVTKNLQEVFEALDLMEEPEKAIVLFDGIDAFFDGSTSYTVREALKGLSGKLVVLARTAKPEVLDVDFLTAFDRTVDFNRYSKEELQEVAYKILGEYQKRITAAQKDLDLFRDVMKLFETMPYPGDLKNMIRASLDYSNPEKRKDYLRQIYELVQSQR